MHLVGKTLGRYRIVEPIGQGGMASVYKAYQASLDRFVAIKVISPQHAQTPEYKKRFFHEAKAVAKLSHPNILPVYDLGMEDNISYLAMKYVPGRTLKDVMGEPMPLPRVCRFMDQIAGALDLAHSQGIIHRDVKPANLLLEGDWLFLTDFGIAKILEGSTALTMPGEIMGTPFYMSPEQGTGVSLDHRTDIYSLGIMLYEMLTGVVPFRGETPYGIVFRHVHDPLPLPRQHRPDLPESVERIVLKALAKQPADRYDRAGQMAEALRAAVERVPVAPWAETVPVSSAPPSEAKPPPPDAVVEPPPALEAPPPKPDPIPEHALSSQPFPEGEDATGSSPTPPPPAPEPPPARRKRFGLLLLGGTAAILAGLLLLFFPPAKKEPVMPAPSMQPTGGNPEGEAPPPKPSGPKPGEVWKEPVTGMEFVWVPGGTYMMGCGSWTSECSDNESPVHEVSLKGFWIGKTEVTQGQWKAVTGGTPSAYKKDADYPVEQVSWNDAQGFIEKLNRLNDGRFRFRLPTEAEWEYAARSGGKPEKYAGGNDPDMAAWYGSNSRGSTHPVGTKSPNGLGIYDMSGNVWEWCMDIYASDSYRKHSRDNPIYADTSGGSNRVFRGGGWVGGPQVIRCANRLNGAPGYWSVNVGFRLVRTP